MFRNNVYTFKNLPVQEKQRPWTDCFCTICTAIFALTLFILSFVMYHRQNFFEVNYPVDDTGKTCGYDRQDAQLIYFKNPNDLSQGKYCVKNCPKYNQPIQCDSDQNVQCIMMGGSQYSTKQVVNRLGAFCMAQDQQTAQKMWNSPQFQTKNSLLHSFDVVLISLLIALCIGVLYLILVICCPKVMTYLVFVTTFILLLIAGIFILAKPINFFNPNGWNIFLGICLIIASLVFLIYVGCYRRQLQLAAIFMHHSNRFLKQTPIVFAYIPLFLVLTFLLIVLIIWQYIAFGTQYEPIYNEGDLYKSSQQNVALQVFNIIELIWGLQFLRDAFNFVVSGNAVQWYFRKANNNNSSHCCHPFTRLLCKNWGSVAGGSFLNAFFNIPDLVSDLFKCEPRGFCGKCNSCYQDCCCCDYIFELVRTDAYAYINLTGIPYCNAARQCEAMCQYSEHFRSSQSCIRLYRLAAHISLVALIAIISFFILEGRASYVNGFIIAGIVFGSYCIVTYFIDIHADGAQGLMVCYLVEENCEGDEMDICPLGLRNDVYNLAHPDYHY